MRLRTNRWIAVWAGALAIALALFTASLATAQGTAPKEKTAAEKAAEQKAADAKAAQEAPVTEVITVTAQKQGEQNVKDVPFSVAAPTDEVLRSRGADNIEGVAANVAGFSVQNLGPGQSQVALRGVSSGQIVRDQPGVKEQVGAYLDESVISLSLFTPDIDLFDMARVEVLRGPQGTLFGAGSESGTVRYITNQPEIGVSDATAELDANTISGGDPGGSVKVAANAALGTKAALRVTGYYNKIGGFIDAVQPSLAVKDNFNSAERSGVRLAPKAQPNENLTITPRVIYQKVKAYGWNSRDVFNILANPFTTTRPRVTLGKDQQFTQIGEPFDDKFLLGDLNIDYKMGNADFTSITSYTDRKIDVVRDATALTASITGGSIGLPPAVYNIGSPLDDATHAKVFTEEMRLAGKSDNVNWLVGGFYGDTDRKYGQTLLVNGFESLTGIPTAGQFGAPRDVLFFSRLHYKLKQYALFGEATWKLGDRFSLTGGLRYYHFSETRVQTFDGIFADDGTTHGKTDANGFAPRVMMNFAASPTTNLNAQVSKGFRLGGINDPLNVPLCTPNDLHTFANSGGWKDETLWNYEVGSKSSFMGGHGSLNLAAYYMDIRDLQATVTAGSCSSRVVFNVPKARAPGVEIELSAAPSTNFDFAISGSYTDSKLESTLTSTDAAGNVTVVGGIEKGNRLPSVPKFQMVAAATFQHPMLTSWLGYVTATYQYVGSRYTQIGDQAVGFGTVDPNSF